MGRSRALSGGRGERELQLGGAPAPHHPAPRPELEALIPGFRPAFASNDFVVQRRAVAEGLGAMILPATRDADEPYAPLVELPLDLPLPEGELFIVCAKAMRSVPRVEGVLNLLCERFEAVEGVKLERREK